MFLTLAFGVPLLIRPWWAVLFWYGVTGYVAGLIASCVLPLAHTVPAAGFPLPHADGLLADSWSAHQVATTVDFARRNWILNWLLGGLNFQIEHHLFPRICHVHYPALSEIVEATCREFGVPYHAYPSFGTAIAAHYRWLRMLGPDYQP
jgi:linoleoyl-CoA desaturase